MNGRINIPGGKMMHKGMTGLVLGGSVLLVAAQAFAQSPNQPDQRKQVLGQELVAPGTLYSPGVRMGGTIYVAGLQGTDPSTHKLPADFGQEVRNCLNNLGRVLKDGGMNYDDVMSVQIFLVDLSQFQQVNDIYKEYFKVVYPARTTIQVAKLSLGSRIEISAVAQKQEDARNKSVVKQEK
jgi:2-iminobutanoate/2-iminopropanoate deaminase